MSAGLGVSPPATEIRDSDGDVARTSWTSRALALLCLLGVAAGTAFAASLVHSALSDAWVAPLRLSPDNERVVDLRVQQTKERADRARLSAEIVGMDEELAGALAAFRQGNYEQVYFRPASVSQGAAVVALLRGLVEHFADQPNRIPGVDEAGGLAGGSGDAVAAAVAYVAGMTDRFAMASAVTDLGWDPRSLPRGIEELGHG